MSLASADVPKRLAQSREPSEPSLRAMIRASHAGIPRGPRSSGSSSPSSAQTSPAVRSHACPHACTDSLCVLVWVLVARHECRRACSQSTRPTGRGCPRPLQQPLMRRLCRARQRMTAHRALRWRPQLEMRKGRQALRRRSCSRSTEGTAARAPMLLLPVRLGELTGDERVACAEVTAFCAAFVTAIAGVSCAFR